MVITKNDEGTHAHLLLAATNNKPLHTSYQLKTIFIKTFHKLQGPGT